MSPVTPVGSHLQFSPAHMSASDHPPAPRRQPLFGPKIEHPGGMYRKEAHADSGCWCRGSWGAGCVRCSLPRGPHGLLTSCGRGEPEQSTVKHCSGPQAGPSVPESAAVRLPRVLGGGRRVSSLNPSSFHLPGLCSFI